MTDTHLENVGGMIRSENVPTGYPKNGIMELLRSFGNNEINEDETLKKEMKFSRYEDVEDQETKKLTISDWKNEVRTYLCRTDLPYVALDSRGDNFSWEQNIVCSAMYAGGSFTVSSDSGRYRYTIIFMENAPPLYTRDGELRRNIPNLPLCSCRAYYYQAYDKRNQCRLRGACKHLRDVYVFVNKLDEFNRMNWNFRSDDPMMDPWAILMKN